MPGEIGGGGRHYQGPETQVPYAWTCPRCGTRNVTPLEDGCPGCGAGTAAEQDRLRREAKADPDGTEEVGQLPESFLVGFTSLPERHRLTIARALAHYADHGGLSFEELSKRGTLALARMVNSLNED